MAYAKGMASLTCLWHLQPDGDKSRKSERSGPEAATTHGCGLIRDAGAGPVRDGCPPSALRSDAFYCNCVPL